MSEEKDFQSKIEKKSAPPPTEKPASIEKIKESTDATPEKSFERQPEETKENQRKNESAPPTFASSRLAPEGNEALRHRERSIEKILEEGMSDFYLKLPPAKKREFKAVGEETAKQINSLLNEAKLRIKKILALVKKWLAIIPGVNKFFLEQESKIKVDQIIKLKNDKI